MLGVVNFLITSTHTGAKGQVHFIYDLGEEADIQIEHRHSHIPLRLQHFP